MELIINAFILGLYGSAHCVSMCGPVVGILGINTHKNRIASAFLYNFGRISTYAFLGLIAALLSVALRDLRPLQLVMRYLAGILMLFVALQFFGYPKYLSFIEQPVKKFTTPITRLSKKFFPINTPTKAYCAGLVWGLFPCGMVYTAFLISLNATTFIQAPIIMFAFGLGTFAVMITISLFGNYAGKWLMLPKLRVIAGILILVMTLIYMIPMMMKDLGFSNNQNAHGAMMEQTTEMLDHNLQNSDTENLMNHSQHMSH